MSKYPTLNVQISAHFGSFFAYSSFMVLEGETGTTPETLPTIIPELQNKSVISVVHGRSGFGRRALYGFTSSHFGALTSSGKLLTWGRYSGGALGLGDPDELPLRSPGGYAEEEQRAQAQNQTRTHPMPPPDVTVPSEVRFDHGLKTKERAKTYCFAVAAGEWHTGALVVDLAEGGVPLEDLE